MAKAVARKFRLRDSLRVLRSLSPSPAGMPVEFLSLFMQGGFNPTQFYALMPVDFLRMT
jgi:hypothetical protein